MRVLILADGSFASREHSLLARLEIALADEGIRVAHAIPTDCPVDAAPGIYSTFVRYEEHGTAFSRSGRARRLIESLAVETGEEDGAVDLVHAFGEGTWPLALEVAHQTGARVALEVWAAGLVHSAARIAHEAARDEDNPLLLLTPGRMLSGLLKKAAPDARVFVTPWGVAASEAMHDLLQPGQAPSATVMATGKHPDLIGDALEGLAEAARRAPDLVVFLDAHAADRPAVWKRARSLKLLDRLTVVPELEARREPILRMDLLIQPEALGEHRSMTLSAMASGTVVVARADPLVENLASPELAELAHGPSPAAWAQAIGAVLENPQHARALAAKARDYVKAEHSLSGHIRSVCAAYECLEDEVKK